VRAGQAYGEAPRQRDRHDQLGRLGDGAEELRQHKAGAERGQACEQADAQEREHDRRELRRLEARLKRQDHDRPDVLEDQQAHGEPAGEP